MNARHVRPTLALLTMAFLIVAGASLALPACHGSVRSDTDSTATLPLEQTHWSLVWLAGRPISQTNARREAYVIFDSERQVARGSSGCNSYNGKYTLNGHQLGITEVISTKMACLGGMELETDFFDALQATARWSIVGRRLELYDARDAVVAAFEEGPML